MLTDFWPYNFNSFIFWSSFISKALESIKQTLTVLFTFLDIFYGYILVHTAWYVHMRKKTTAVTTASSYLRLSWWYVRRLPLLFKPLKGLPGAGIGVSYPLHFLPHEGKVKSQVLNPSRLSSSLTKTASSVCKLRFLSCRKWLMDPRMQYIPHQWPKE